MSDPLTATGTTALVSATIAAPAVGIDYGVIFGAFIGAMFYVTQAKDIPRIRQAFSFVVSFGTGVLGARCCRRQAFSMAELQRHAARAVRCADHLCCRGQAAYLRQ